MNFLKKVQASSDKQLESFFAEYKAKTVRHPFDPRSRIWNDEIIFEVRIWDNKVWLSFMMVLENPRQGSGTKGLAWLTALADKYQVPIGATVKPVGELKMPKAKLMSFYKKAGFKVERGDTILRQPILKLGGTMKSIPI